MLDNDKMMLIYGFNEDDKDELKTAIYKNNLPQFKVITREMANMKIEDIINGLRFEIYNPDLPDEMVILFNNFNDSELDRAIKVVQKFKKNSGRDIILAAVTENSAKWTFKELLDHLIEERNWYKSH